MTITHMSYKDFCAQYPDEDSILKKIFEMRYSFKACPNCGHKKPYQKIKGRKGYQCSKRGCNNQIFPLSQTPLRATKLDIRTWVYVIHLFVNAKTGLTAANISRIIPITAKTALRMLTVIRLNLNNFKGELSGVIEADETLWGPRIGRLSNSRRKELNKQCKEQGVKAATGRSLINKIPIFGMVERGGRIIAKIVPNQRGTTLLPIINQHTSENSTIYTDEANCYNDMSADYVHKTCNHQRRTYVIKEGEEKISTNTIEGAWNLFKKSLRSYFSINRRFLPLYLEECCFRYNARRIPDLGFWNLFCNLIHPLAV